MLSVSLDINQINQNNGVLIRLVNAVIHCNVMSGMRCAFVSLAEITPH